MIARRALALFVAVSALLSAPACSKDSKNADGHGGTGGRGGAGGNGGIGGGMGGSAGVAAGSAGSGGTSAAGAGGASGAGAAGTSGAGAAGTSGAGGAAGSGGLGPECQTPADCKLINDCCACRAIPVGQTHVACPAICTDNKCNAELLATTAVGCIAGRCVAGFDCDTSKVQCPALPPNCAPGEVPAVRDSCYAGCVPASQCRSVSSCDLCGPGEACSMQAFGSRHCVSIPESCNGNATCDCFGPTTCIVGLCSELPGGKGVGCVCAGC